MPAEKNTWIGDAEGNKAYVESVDAWSPHGWSEATEPAHGDFVWLEHEATGGKQRFAAAAAPTWQALGWNPTAPPEPVDLTKDQNLVDVAPVQPVAVETPKKAASGSKKEQ